MPGTGKKYLII